MKKLNLKKKLLSTAMCLSLVAGIVPAGMSLPRVLAYTPSDSIITSGEFTTSSTNFPASSSDWSSADGSMSNTKLKSGIISTSADDFSENQEKYALGALPNSMTGTSNDVYMINSGLTATRAGVSSESFTLDANSHYIISVDVATSLPVFVDGQTSDIESIASIYLKGENINESFTAVNTNKNWKTFNFYVTTDTFKSTTANLELWLGAKNLHSTPGAVLFDNAKAIKYDSAEFFTRLNSASFTSNNNKYADYSLEDTALVSNASFEDATLTGWTKEYNANSPMSKVFSGVTALDSSFDGASHGNISNPGTNLQYGNNKALFINNTDKAGVSYTSDAFTIQRQTYHKLSVFVKTQNIVDGGASISIVPVNEDLTSVEFTNITTTTTTNSITNDWVEYSFYILGSPFQDEQVRLVLSLGDVDATENLDTALVEGAVFFDDIKTYSIDYKQYTSASEDTHNKKVKLFGDVASTNIKNAYFNYADENYEGVYPLAPADWTINNSNNLSGIISTNVTHFNANATNYGNISVEDIGFTRLQYDQSETADNNLLMIRNGNSDYTAFSSNAYSLSNDTHYKLTIDVKTITTGNAHIQIVSGETTLTEFVVNSNDKWSTYTAYINNVYGARDLQVIVGLGTPTENATGYAFFDNIILSDIEEDIYADAVENDTTTIIDFGKENFDMISSQKDGIYYTPNNWTINVSNNDLVDTGVLVGDKNALVISSIQSDLSATYTSKLTYTLDEETYYALKFKVYATGLEGLENSGIEVGLKDTSYYIKDIADTEEAEYIFYIKGSAQSSLTPYFKLYTQDAQSVTAYLTDLTLEVIGEVDFTNVETQIKEESEEAPTNVVLIGSNEEEEEEEEEVTPTTGGAFDWILVPTLIIGLALIVAIIGVIMRRTKIKKVSRHKRSANYDRTKTLHPEIVRREAEEARKAKLQAIEAELKKNQEMLDAYEEEYRQKRDLAMAQKQEKKAQAEFKAYAKGRAKLAKKQEKLIEQKELVNSDEYLHETEEKILKDYEESASIESQEIITENENTGNADI